MLTFKLYQNGEQTAEVGGANKAALAVRGPLPLSSSFTLESLFWEALTSVVVDANVSSLIG